MTPRSVAMAVALFRWLTVLMPRRYRERHRDEAADLMARLAAEAHRRAGVPGVMRAAGRSLLDLLLCALTARTTRTARAARPGARGIPPLSGGGLLSRATVDALWRDAVYGVRALRRQPVSSAAAIATLAVGIGLNAAVFAVVDWVLLRPLPYPSAHELVRVFTAGTAPVTPPADLTPSEFVRFSEAAVFRASAAFSTAVRVVTGPGVEPTHVTIARVSGDLFATLGVYPSIGRGFDRGDADAGAPLLVISHAFWRTRFAADPAIVGRLVTIDSQPHTIVGVMPSGRGYPAGADLWRPLTATERDDDREHVMIGRLRSGVPAEQASAALAARARADADGPAGRAPAAPASPSASGSPVSPPAALRTAWVEDVQRAEVRDVRAVLTAVWISAALILIMACANVAALFGARATERAGEIALRGALGASRARLLGQLLIESLLLAAAGGIAGLLIGRWALDILLTVAPGELPRLREIALDRRIVILGAGGTLLVGLAVGLAPSLRASRLDFRGGLGPAGSARAPRGARGRRLLVAAQTAMAVLLTIGAGLLARSLEHLVTIEQGFAPDGLVAVDLYLRGNVGDVRPMHRALVERAESVPGVRAAAVAMRLPTQLASLRVPVRVDGLPAGAAAHSSAASAPRVTLRGITPRYFETAGIPLLRGRAFTARDIDTAPGVAIVNATFVRDVLGGHPALGLTLSATDLVPQPLAIVGVAADVTPAGEADRPAMYVPLEQIGIGGGALLVRMAGGAGDPSSVVPALAARLRAATPAMALDRIHHVADAIDAGRAVTRFNLRLASAFAGLALLLAAIGVYGLTTGEVDARWRELAVRIALGATRRDALWTVIRPGAAALGAGMAAGLAATLGAGRWMAALLHGVEPADPATLLVVPVLLAVVGLASASLAAARILRADPAAALRRE